MNFIRRIHSIVNTRNVATFVFFVAVATAKYSSDVYLGGSSSGGVKQKLPIILMHKQALAEDGGFNFAFAGDNGIKHGETIRPDGTRSGAYSYIDPNGETISVKYTAGKKGFQILQGDHIPRAPLSPPSLQGAASSNRYMQPLTLANSLSRSSMPTVGVAASDETPNFKALYRVYEENSAEHYPQDVPYSKARYEPEEDNKRPHSFGSGYSFEFGQSH